jgi:hypothetical protein
MEICKICGFLGCSCCCPPCSWVPLKASAACAAAGGWLPAACKHTVLQEFAPETAAAVPSCFSLGEAWTPIQGWAWACPKSKWGRKDLLVSSRCLQTCTGQCQPQKLPRRNHVHFSRCNSAILMWLPLKTTEVHCRAQNRPRWKVTLCEVWNFFFCLTIARGINNLLFIRKTKRNTI